MGRQYSSAAHPDGWLTWVDGDRARARQVLADLDAAPAPADESEADQRAQLVDALRALFPSFSLDGVEFWVYGELQMLDLTELMGLARVNTKSADPRALAALGDFFRGALGDGEYERFRAHCRSHCTPPDVLSEVMEGVVEDLAEVPTLPPTPSARGRSSTGPTSRVVSLSAGTSQEAPMTPEAFAAWQAGQAAPPGPLGQLPPDPDSSTPRLLSFG
jgi:hypothetical protein